MKKNLLLIGANCEAVVRIFGMCALSALITLFIACENPFLRLADKKIVLPPGKEVSGLIILKQPDKMSYTHGDILDLTGLIVTLTYDDGTNENVLFEKLAEMSITTLPAQGASVSHSNHNAKAVTVKLGELEAQTGALTVGKREIKIADVNIIGPMKNAIPNTEASIHEDAYYSAGEVSWTPSHDSFIGETIYMASLALVPDNDHIFAEDIEAIINGYAETVITENTGSFLKLSLEFAKTLNKAVVGILVVNQPSVLTYTHGDSLDITGLTVNILYDDNTNEIVPIAGFHSRNISVSPYDSEQLRRSVYNGHPVVVSLGEIHANTNNLTVNQKPITLSITAFSRTTLTPITGETSSNFTVSVIGGLLNNDNAVITCTSLPAGLTIAGSIVNNGSNTITYNGVTAILNPSVVLNFSADAGSNYTLGTTYLTVNVFDGQANYTGAAGTYDRRIPVTSANINAFNTYANTTAGLTRHYKLTQNVTLTAVSAGSNWTAIGNSYSTRFSGSFNGRGYIIYNLTINSALDYQGMFGNSSGNINNLGLVGGSISGGQYVGGIVGSNSGEVQYCYTTGSINGGSSVGGITGYNSSTVQNCYTTGNISGVERMGGIVGNNFSNTSIVQNCYATGNVRGGGSRGGGIAGDNPSGTVQNCYATGNITEGNWRGGIVGIASGSESTIRNCAALNKQVIIYENNSFYVGRIVGFNPNNGTLANNVARSDMTIRYNTSTTYTPTSSSTGKDGLSFPVSTLLIWTAAELWQDALQFSAASWEFRTGLGLPILRNMPAGTQNPIVVP